jgi:hypothetical protein
MDVWTYIKNISELFKLLAVFIVILGVVYWWWYNRKRSWWVWGLYFWPRRTNSNLINSPDGLPLVITLRCLIVNVSIFPKVIEEVSLVINRVNDARRFEFDPYAFMGPLGFVQTEQGWSHDQQELFRPFVVEARSNASQHILFIPVGPENLRLQELSAGHYKAILEFKKARGKPIKIAFDFDLQEGEVDGFLDAETAVGKLTRNLSYI